MRMSRLWSGFDRQVQSRDRRDSFMVGVDTNYLLEMHRDGRRWFVDGREVDPLAAMASHGAGWIRLRVFTREEGINGTRYAVETAELARRWGYRLLLNLFLSDRWCTANHQPAPEEWMRLPLSRRCDEIRAYTRATVARFLDRGCRPSLYQVGNEIEYGICGIMTSSVLREDPDWMRRHGTWCDIATVLRSAHAGILDADPGARFVVHAAHWFNPRFGVEFFDSLRSMGVDFEFAGCSYYPTSGIPEHHFGIGNGLTDLGGYVDAVHERTGCRVLVLEYGYPRRDGFLGPFCRWNKQVNGYELSSEGQRRWIDDFLRWCHRTESVAGAFYWSPEYYCSDDWEAFALFDTDGRSLPALTSLRGPM